MEFVEVGKFVAAFALVVGLIGLMSLAMRKFGNPAMRVRSRDEARLKIVETLPIDARSRLLLIRRDNMEHLLVKSGDRFEVVEVDIPCEDATEEESTGPSLFVKESKESLSHAA
jgi:flagellar protein FliO/FliZ